MKKNIIPVIMLSSFVGFVVYATIETRPLQEESSSYNQEISEEVNKIAVEETRTIQKEDNKISLPKITNVEVKTVVPSETKIIDNSNIEEDIEIIYIQEEDDDYYRYDDEENDEGEELHESEEDDD